MGVTPLASEASASAYSATHAYGAATEDRTPVPALPKPCPTTGRLQRVDVVGVSRRLVLFRNARGVFPLHQRRPRPPCRLRCLRLRVSARPSSGSRRTQNSGGVLLDHETFACPTYVAITWSPSRESKPAPSLTRRVHRTTMLQGQSDNLSRWRRSLRLCVSSFV